MGATNYLFKIDIFNFLAFKTHQTILIKRNIVYLRSLCHNGHVAGDQLHNFKFNDLLFIVYFIGDKTFE